MSLILTDRQQRTREVWDHCIWLQSSGECQRSDEISVTCVACVTVERPWKATHAVTNLQAMWFAGWYLEGHLVSLRDRNVLQAIFEDPPHQEMLHSLAAHHEMLYSLAAHHEMLHSIAGNGSKRLFMQLLPKQGITFPLSTTGKCSIVHLHINRSENIMLIILN